MDTSITQPKDAVGLLVLLLAAVVVPFLVDLVTKRSANAAVKAWVLFVLSLVNGILTSFITAHNENVDWDWKGAALGFVTSLITSAAFFFGLYKPAHLAGADGPIQHALPGGLGAAQTNEEILIQQTPTLPPEEVDTDDPGRHEAPGQY